MRSACAAPQPDAAAMRKVIEGISGRLPPAGCRRVGDVPRSFARCWGAMRRSSPRLSCARIHLGSGRLLAQPQLSASP
eukprot:6621260-Pyramimonas_sp.AAC.2